MEDGLVRINTFHAHRFDPTAAQTEDICVEDIAHALSLLCRANGHLRHFYSVGQHSLACQREAAARGWTPRVQLLCLLHDASEAYIGDLTRPLKRHLPAFDDIERRLQGQIFAALGVAPPTEAEAAQVAEIDDAMLYWEFQRLHPTGIECRCLPLTGPLDLSERAPAAAEADFLAAYAALKEAL